MKQDFMILSRDILGGVPVFKGTRVPIQNLIDYLEDFPTANRTHAILALEFAKEKILEPELSDSCG